MNAERNSIGSKAQASTRRMSPMLGCTESSLPTDHHGFIIGSKAPLLMDSRSMLDSLHLRLLGCRVRCACEHVLDIYGLFLDACGSLFDVCERLFNALVSRHDVSGRRLEICATSRCSRQFARSLREPRRYMQEPPRCFSQGNLIVFRLLIPGSAAPAMPGSAAPARGSVLHIVELAAMAMRS